MSLESPVPARFVFLNEFGGHIPHFHPVTLRNQVCVPRILPVVAAAHRIVVELLRENA